MENINLTSDEKRVLKLAESRYDKQPEEFSIEEYTRIVRSLRRMGLVDAVFAVGERVSIVWLTDYGVDFLKRGEAEKAQITKDDLRKFLNDIKTIVGIAVGVMAIIGFVVGLMACTLLLN